MDANLISLIGECVVDVARFLDMKGVGTLEQVAVLHPMVRERCWEEAVATAVEKFPVWGPSACQFLEELKTQEMSSQQHARDIVSLRRTLFPPSSWQPWICKAGFSSLKLNPYTDTFLEDENYWNSEAQRLPCPAAVPLSIGAFRRQPFVVGIDIKAEGQLDDNLCFSVEGRNAVQTVPVIMLAPFSGNCWIQLARRGPMMKAAILKPLEVVPASLRLWIQIYEDGCIRFLREVEGSEPEDAGIYSSASLPRWIEEYFACLYHWGDSLQAAATVSVEHAGTSFPARFVDKPTDEMDAVWELVDPELW
eukprot:TRINITY_DN9184_c0_g1_i2.p1 TRINITY_DN9184_c0_g1~~TRINITY_DN9184_c0_g1_i2.p1  ORF type:complete len:320 (-),score=43.07 TRINITY_DN9184_c0_g1_i2:599-1519(-)